MPRDRHFESFGEHTQLKHLVLKSYLQQWATILLSRFPKVLFVDAFAGAGRDQAGIPGSPIIAAETAQRINLGSGDQPKMRVVAIEQSKKRHHSLVDSLRPYIETQEKGHRFVFHHNGTLAEKIDSYLKRIAEPTLFFIDPFGIDGLECDVLKKALRGSHNELLILFSDEGAVRLHGKIAAPKLTREQRLAAMDAGRSLLGSEFDAQQEASAREAVERCMRGHESSQRAKQILDRAFGGNWWQPIISATPEGERQQKFVDLYQQVLMASGAVHVLPFSVDTKDGRHKYFLLHASKKRRAYTTMKEAISRVRRQHTEPKQQVLDPEFEVNTDLEGVADKLAQHFAGRQVRWQSNESETETVRKYALDYTPVFPDELEVLKTVLTRHGWRAQRRPLAFAFPK